MRPLAPQLTPPAIFRAVWELVADHGPRVPSDEVAALMEAQFPNAMLTRLVEDGALVVDAKTVTLGWIDALLRRAPAVLGAFSVPLEVVQAMYPLAELHPAPRPSRTLIVESTVSLTTLLALKPESIVIYGDGKRAQVKLPSSSISRAQVRTLKQRLTRAGRRHAQEGPHGHGAGYHLARRGPPPSGADDPHGRPLPVAAQGCVAQQRRGNAPAGVLRYDELNTVTRLTQLVGHFKPRPDKDAEREKEKRILIVFAYNDRMERDKYESSRFAPGITSVVVGRPVGELAVGAIVSVHWTHKGPVYRQRDRIVKVGSAQLEPLVTCFAPRLTALMPGHFDVVILVGNSRTPQRFVDEAIRVAGKGTTVLCGVN